MTAVEPVLPEPSNAALARSTRPQKPRGRKGPPKAPAPVLFIRLAAPKIPNGWQPYLANWGSATAAA